MATLTSSRFAAAAGLCPYTSRYKLFQRLTGREPYPPANPAMQWGIDNEALAVMELEVQTGLAFRFTGKNQRFFSRENFGSTPDGIAEIAGRRIGAEVKCPGRLPDAVPTHYVVQMIGQAWCARLDEILWGSWTPDGMRIWRYTYADWHWEWLRPLLDDFLTLLETDTPPPKRKPRNSVHIPGFGADITVVQA